MLRKLRRSAHALAVAIVLVAGSAPPAGADIAVVVNPDCPLQNLTQQQVSDLYLGRRHSIGELEPLQILDQPPSSPLRERFFLQINGMDLRRLNAYWARLQFSGDTQPPTPLADSRQIVEVVARNRCAIGYVEPAYVTANVRTVLLVKE
ncbi:MAG TPA: hypothetical protein VFH22_04745 [Rhodocyclaceae bacterium]|nr:hypothetical protein [Rhodocyclaceae bacterium]